VLLLLLLLLLLLWLVVLWLVVVARFGGAGLVAGCRGAADTRR
jgi:hypothetical protein